MRWILMFFGVCAALVTAAFVGLWAATGFETWDLSLHGVIALVLGAALTSALAIALMALLFYSDRSGHDDVAAGPPERPPGRRDPRF